MIISHPLYSAEHKRYFNFIFMGAIFGMGMVSLVLSFVNSTDSTGGFSFSAQMAQQMVGFVSFLGGFYFFMSFSTFRIIVIDKEKREFSLCRTLFGKVIQRRPFNSKHLKEFIVTPLPNIKDVFQLIAKGRSFEISMARGSLTFIEELSQNLGRDLSVSVKKKS
jgi:hypothetical protein